MKLCIPFTCEEIKKASNELKNNKSTGKDDIAAELIKYAPNEVQIYKQPIKLDDRPLNMFLLSKY